MGVVNYKLKDSSGGIVFQYQPNSCFAAFIIDGGYPQPPKADLKHVVRMDITVTSSTRKDFVDSDLIQTLSPGMKWVSEYRLEIPLVGIPFDQIICALRLLKFSSIRECISRNNDDFISDSTPCFFGFTLKDFMDFYDNWPKFHTPDYNAYHIATTGTFTRGLEKGLGVDTLYLNASAYPSLIKGHINKGVVPEYTSGEGYAKWYSILGGLMERHKTKVAPGNTPSKLCKYYDEAYVTVNHPICVFDVDLAKELASKFKDAGKDSHEMLEYLEKTYGKY